MDTQKREAVDGHYEEMLSKIPAPIAQRVREMYSKDEGDFIAAAVAACPSTDPAYWAKSSCKRCRGTSYVGTQVQPRHKDFGQKISCHCGDKRYTKWIRGFRDQYNERTNHGTTTQRNSTTEA